LGKDNRKQNQKPKIKSQKDSCDFGFWLLTFDVLCRMMISDDLQQRWWTLEAKLVDRFGKKPDLEAVLFLIGMQETGFVQEKISKEQKQDLMHVAVCTVLKSSGYYELEGMDEDGWPHFRQLKELPALVFIEQEHFIKDHVLLYFEQQGF
jgi:hypothetical protein